MTKSIGTKVLFLDIDGVLNECLSQSRAPSGVIGIDDDKVQLLRQIIEATGAQIILTSSWRKSWSRHPLLCRLDGEYLDSKLAQEGLCITGKVSDAIWDRGEGIREWLGGHPTVKTWVALDDDIFPDFEEKGIMPHLVQTNFYTGGLAQEHVNMCIAKLNVEGDDTN